MAGEKKSKTTKQDKSFMIDPFETTEDGKHDF